MMTSLRFLTSSTKQVPKPYRSLLRKLRDSCPHPGHEPHKYFHHPGKHDEEHHKHRGNFWQKRKGHFVDLSHGLEGTHTEPHH